MGDDSKIEWTDATWNPIRARRNSGGKSGWHCEKVSAGCANCYAERFNSRNLPGGGTGLKYNKVERELVTIFIDDDVVTQPCRWKRPRKIFVGSMTDLFGEFVTDAQIDRVFAAMIAGRRHTYQILTKRAERMRAYLSDPQKHERWSVAFKKEFQRFDRCTGGVVDPWWPNNSDNFWIGVSVEDQETADERVPLLMQTPAARRFVSYEPALGPVDFGRFMWPTHERWPSKFKSPEEARAAGATVTRHRQGLVLAGRRFIDWVIVGGESGPGARPFDLAWARKVVDDCSLAGVACFVKQFGSYWAKRHGADRVVRCGPNRARSVPHNSKGGDMAEWPDDLRVRQFPSDDR